jgi:hypothetical protein
MFPEVTGSTHPAHGAKRLLSLDTFILKRIVTSSIGDPARDRLLSFAGGF